MVGQVIARGSLVYPAVDSVTFRVWLNRQIKAQTAAQAMETGWFHVAKKPCRNAVAREWQALYKVCNTGSGYARKALFASRKSPCGFACPELATQTRSRRARRKALICSAGNEGFAASRLLEKAKPGVP